MFLYLYKKPKEKISVVNSTNGTTSHTPSTPSIYGKVTIPITNNINVLSNESKAEVFPSENAVNIPEVKIFIPLTMKLKEKIINPLKVISNRVVPFAAKVATKNSDENLDIIKVITPKIITVK